MSKEQIAFGNAHLGSITKIQGDDISALFPKEDTAVKYRYFHKVKFLRQLSKLGTRDSRNQIITEFNNNLERSYNDHRHIIMNPHTEPNHLFEPLQVEKFPNMVVLSGLTKMAEILTDQSSSYFNFIEIGEGSEEVNLLNTHLAFPVYRVNVHDLGWFEPHGTTVRTGSLFPEDTPNCTIREIGGFDAAEDPSKMGWRVVIEDAAKYLKHEIGISYITISHIHTLI